jgi:hypothetical protein
MHSANMTQALRKGVVATCFALFCAVLAALMYLDAYYYDNRPRTPDPLNGRIYPEVVKSLGAGRCR